MGYSVGWGSWEAADIGAWHHRERVFIIAHNTNASITRSRKLSDIKRKKDFDIVGKSQFNSNSNIPGLQRCRKNGERTSECTIGEGTWKEPWFEAATRLCGTGDGIPKRVDRLKCLGNAVVPQQVYPILKAIAEIEKGGVI